MIHLTSEKWFKPDTLAEKTIQRVGVQLRIFPSSKLGVVHSLEFDLHLEAS